jgi:hypothetical protein
MRASRSEGPLRGVGHVLHGLPGPPLTSEGRVGTKLTPPKEVDAYTNDYKEESDVIARFSP